MYPGGCFTDIQMDVTGADGRRETVGRQAHRGVPFRWPDAIPERSDEHVGGRAW